MSDFFQWAPNWGSPVIERMEWLTDVQQSANGTEHRRALRALPRSSITYEVLVEGVEAIKLRNFLRTNQGKEVWIPWWLGGVSASYSGSFQYMPEHPKDRGFYVGVDSAVAISQDGASKKVTVDSITPSAIEVNSTLSPGDRIYPLVRAVLSSSMQLESPTDTIIKMMATFDVLDPMSYSTLDEINAFRPSGRRPSHGTLSTIPNRAKDVTSSFERMTQELDFLTGLRAHTDRSKQSFAIRQHEYFYGERSEAYAMKNFLRLVQGRRGEFYSPTWECDFEFLRFDDDTSSFYYKDVGYYDLAPTERPQDVVLLGGISGDPADLASRVFQGVTLSQQPQGEELLDASASNPSAATVTQAKKISWFERVRFDTDSVEIIWMTPCICTISLPLRTIRRS